MAEASIAGQIRDVLSKVHSSTRLGQMATVPGDGYAVVPPDIPRDEVIQSMFLEVQALGAIVVRLANEVDRLNAAKAVSGVST